MGDLLLELVEDGAVEGRGELAGRVERYTAALSGACTLVRHAGRSQ